MQEIWKPIPGFEHYMVSNLGNVMRVQFLRSKTKEPKIVTQRSDHGGYKTVDLFRRPGKVRKTVHRLVALAFIGNCPTGYQVNHINGIRNDNRAENLEYVTPSENKRHGFRIGITPKPVGEKNGCAKLKDEQVREIKKRCLTERTSALAREFGVTFMAISFIKHGVNWKHIRI